MREYVNGKPLPRGWRTRRLSELLDLADSVGAVYWLDEATADVGSAERQIRQSILAASEADYAPAVRRQRPRSASPHEAARLRAAAAYVLRNQGMRWIPLAEFLGYADNGAAWTAVKGHCDRTGDPFPDYYSVRHLLPTHGANGKRRTHCPNGHEYTPDNVRRSVNGKCRLCVRAAKRRERQRARTVGAPLTPTERTIVDLAACPNGEIARTLAVSRSTIQGHLKNIYSKLGIAGNGVDRRAQLRALSL